MKLAKLAYLLTLGASLTLTFAGCKKGLDKTTEIPGRKYGSISDTPAQPIGGGTPIGTQPGGVGQPQPTGTTVEGGKPETQGIAAADGDKFRNWIENREEFAAQTVYFDFDKSIVKAGEVGKLEEVARRMKANFQGKALRIEGHCDERGTEEYNRALGDKRAGSIREKLAQLGLDPEMLPTISFGEDRPADIGHEEAAFKKNRRGELILLSPPGSN
jgi:outer membrane protein OmpA-like peptidoglycan-associated protein